MNATLLLALVKGLVDMDTQGEILAEVEQMDLETTIAFMEIREMDKKAAAIAGLPFPVPAVNPIQGVRNEVWVQEGHPEAVENKKKCYIAK